MYKLIYGIISLEQPAYFQRYEFVQKDPGITLYVEHLNMLLVENDSILEESSAIYSINTKVVLHACCYYWEIRHCCCGMNIEKFGEIFPIVLCAQEDYLDSYEAYIQAAFYA